MNGEIGNGCSFVELDNAVYDDVHTVLSSLSQLNVEETESSVWSKLVKIFDDYRKALKYLGSEVSREELRHAHGAYRCLSACVMEHFLKYDYDCNKGDSFLGAMIAEDQDFRIIYVLWQWCIDCANESSGFSDLARELEDIQEFAGSARSEMKRMKIAKLFAGDQDSILCAADPFFDRFTRVVFSLLRCGRFDEAIELSGDLCAPWISLPIRTQEVLIDRTLLPAHLTNRERAPLHFRELSFQIMTKIINEKKYAMGIRMVFAAIVGDWKFLLPLANNFEDRLWCYANAAVQARLNLSLGLKHPVFAPKTAEGIFEAIITTDTSPYHVLMSFMVRGAWNEAIKWMNDFIKMAEVESDNQTLSLYRFFGLVASACHVMKCSYEKDHMKNIIGQMVDVLREKKLFSHIPFYVSILPKQEAMQLIRNVMPSIRTVSERYTFIEALNVAGLDGEGIAVEFGRFHILEEVDHIDRLNWIFACGDEKLLYAVSEANAIIRYYLLLNMESDAKIVINQCEKLKIVDRLANFVRNIEHTEESGITTAAELVIDEFNNHSLYLSAIDNCTTFSVECAKSWDAARQKAEDEQEGHQWSRHGDLVDLSRRTALTERNQSRYEHSKITLNACKERTFDAVVTFLQHPGWRSDTYKDWGRTEQLKALRGRFYINILNMFLRSLDMCKDADVVLKLLPVLADDELKIYEDLTESDLSQFLLDLHVLAGHLLG